MFDNSCVMASEAKQSFKQIATVALLPRNDTYSKFRLKNLLIFIILFLLTFFTKSFADQNISILPSPPKELPFILDLINRYDTDNSKIKKLNAAIEETDDAYVFKQKFQNPTDASKLQVITMFQKGIETIDKRVLLKKGDYNATFFTRLASPKENFETSLIRREKEGDILIFSGNTDIFLYTFSVNEDDSSDLKEWIYAKEPNSENRTSFRWTFRPKLFDWPIVLDKQADGGFMVQRKLLVNGIDPDDEKERERIIKTVRTATKNKIYVPDKEPLGQVMPVVYWTKEGLKKSATMSVKEDRRLTIQINEPKSSYPLLIDPTLHIRIAN